MDSREGKDNHNSSLVYDLENTSLDEEFLDLNEEPPGRLNKIGLVGKTIIILLLLAFISFSFPNISFLLSNQFDFLKQNQLLKNDEIVLNSKEAVVSIEAAAYNGVSKQVKKGTGFNLLEDGLIMTNNHVVADCEQVKISFNNGKTFISQNIRAIDNLDIALIDFNSNNMPTLEIENVRPAESGEEVTIIGNPLGFQRISTRGKVGQYYQMDKNGFTYFDINADIEAGSSGSPVINEDGAVIGIIFAISQITSKENIEKHALAIPLQGLDELLFQTPQKTSISIP
jgi:S1-C subfamily serine protease